LRGLILSFLKATIGLVYLFYISMKLTFAMTLLMPIVGMSDLTFAKISYLIDLFSFYRHIFVDSRQSQPKNNDEINGSES
jgi:hypothetical protein